MSIKTLKTKKSPLKILNKVDKVDKVSREFINNSLVRKMVKKYSKPELVFKVYKEDDLMDIPFFCKGEKFEEKSFYSGMGDVVTIGIRRKKGEWQFGDWVGIPISEIDNIIKQLQELKLGVITN